MKILPNKINKFFDSILSKLSVPKKDRNLLIKSLLDSSIRGVDSHGIRLFSHYVKCIENGRIKAKPKMKLIKKNRGVAVYDADDGLGHVAALKASAIVSSMAKKNGIASIGIINSSHYGAAGVYSMDIAQNDCVGFSFTHSDAFAIPYNGKKPFHGTNPYSFTAPIGNKDFLHADFSSTSIAWNKVMRARANSTKLNSEIALDKYGNYTTNPYNAVSLAPLGGKEYGYKGFGLSSSVEIMCGPLIGMAHGYRLLSMIGPDFSTPRKLGHFLIAISLNAFTTKKQYFKGMKNYMRDLKKQQSKKNNNPNLYPGEKEKNTSKKRLKTGIPIDKELKTDFLFLANKYKVKINL